MPASPSSSSSSFLVAYAASEPNLLKIRLKQSVIERKARGGPWTAKRQERLQAAQRRQQQKQNASLAAAVATSSSTATSKSPTPNRSIIDSGIIRWGVMRAGYRSWSGKRDTQASTTICDTNSNRLNGIINYCNCVSSVGDESACLTNRNHLPRVTMTT